MIRTSAYLALALASLAALLAAARTLGLAGVAQLGIPDAHVAFRLDATAAAFVAVISFVTLCTSVYALGGRSVDERRNGGAGAGAAILIWVGSMIVCTAGDVWFFIFGWELVALGFYVAIAYAGTALGAGRAAYYTLVLTHVAGAGIVASLLALAHAAGSYAIPDVVAAAAALDEPTRAVLFFVLLAGFGAKVGLVPLQGWIPYAYRAAPPFLAALMAGGALNVGFYGIIRFLIGFGGPIPLAWALVVVALGALGAFFGIAWAQAQRGIRSLCAFSSAENSGLIAIGVGIALVGRAIGLPALVGTGIAVAYVQLAAHALAKSLLFLCAAGIRDAAGTTSFERLGGLLRRLPAHGTAALVAALSLAALPPLGGFAGEWLVLEACMQGFRTGTASAEVTLALAGAAVGISAGIAVVAFVKLVGIALLGAPRSPEAAAARERSSIARSLALFVLALAVVALGVATPWYLRALAFAIDPLSGYATVAAMTASLPLVQPAFAGFSSASGLGLGATILLAAGCFALAVALIRRPPPRVAPAWTSGAGYAPWTQYTGTGFANPTRVILDAAVRPVRNVVGSVRASGDEAVVYDSTIRPYCDLALAESVAAVFLRASAVVRRTQSGVIAAYLSYILAFAIALLVFYPSIRHW